MKFRLILVILFSVLAAGCISPEIQTGVPSEYELPGLNNTTFFYLNGSSIQVVESVINATTVDFSTGESGETNFRNPVAQDLSGKNVTFNVSSVAAFGRSYVRFEFSSPFSGFVAYTQSDGMDFTRLLTKNSSVRVVLPENFTTGSKFLGIAIPNPDNITVDQKGREVLIWKNPYPEPGRISVKYYPRSAPVMLTFVFIFLFIAALLISGYYYFGMRALRKKREAVEKGVRK